MESDFFAYMFRLRYIEWWSLMRNTVKENVAEHSFHVALLTHALCTIANEVYGREVPTGRAVSLALFHDATEVFTGDIPTPVKHHNDNILKSFREIEHLAAERLVGMIPGDLGGPYKGLILERDADLKRWVQAADLIDAYLKCVTEGSAGNPEFVVARREIRASLDALEMPEVDYFLSNFAPGFERTLDEMD